MERLAPERVKELKERHGDRLVSVALPGIDRVVVRPPTRPEWRRYQDTGASDPAKRAQAAEQLVRGCVVHPEPETYEGLLDRFPAIVGTLADHVAELAGVVEGVEAEKL